jgi:transcriptional regulator with XRE-family HTH domain
MISSLLNQLKKRRLELGLKQNDMMMRVGISRQQYQRLESKGNPRLDTLELIAKGLNSELMLIPKEKISAVIAVLENAGTDMEPGGKTSSQTRTTNKKSLSDDPWQNLLEEDQ